MYFYINLIIMRRKLSFVVLIVSVCYLSGCGIFNSGCKCPKVSYQAYPTKK